MSIIHLTAAAAVVVAVLCGWAGHRLGTRRMTTLRTALQLAVRTASHDWLTELPNRNQLTTRLTQLDHDRTPGIG